jgi:hypothetical protein
MGRGPVAGKCNCTYVMMREHERPSHMLSVGGWDTGIPRVVPRSSGITTGKLSFVLHLPSRVIISGSCQTMEIRGRSGLGRCFWINELASRGREHQAARKARRRNPRETDRPLSQTFVASHHIVQRILYSFLSIQLIEQSKK